MFLLIWKRFDTVVTKKICVVWSLSLWVHTVKYWFTDPVRKKVVADNLAVIHNEWLTMVQQECFTAPYGFEEKLIVLGLHFRPQVASEVYEI